MQIHETAFIVSTYRSYHEDVSRDPYARLWNNSKTEALIPSIVETISPYEAILHSIRNRFFYEELKDFFTKNKGGTLINFGAGFSMYQFLLDKNVTTIEIDKRDILDFKKNKIEKWVNTGKLPQRRIEYLPVDFNTSSEDQIIKKIKPLINERPVFILLEGVLFFLSLAITNKLFRVFGHLQKTGDVLGSVSYTPDIESTDVYKRLLNYFDSHNDKNDSFNHQTLTHKFYENIDGYELITFKDEFTLLQKYAPQISVNSKYDILNEHLYLLKKI